MLQYIWFSTTELESNYPASNEWAVFMRDTAAQLLSSYIMLLVSLCRLNSQVLNMHNILPSPSGRRWWSLWCNRNGDLAICFVPLWRFRFFVISEKKKVIRETSKGICCKESNLKRLISFKSYWKSPFTFHCSLMSSLKSCTLFKSSKLNHHRFVCFSVWREKGRRNGTEGLLTIKNNFLL